MLKSLKKPISSSFTNSFIFYQSNIKPFSFLEKQVHFTSLLATNPCDLNLNQAKDIPYCQIELKSLDYFLTLQAARKIFYYLKLIIKDFSLKKTNFSFNQIKLPLKRTKISLIRSPHIDKKSQEHFEKRVHKFIFNLHLENLEKKALFIVFLNRLKHLKISGIKICLKINSSTYSKPIIYI